MTEVLCLLIGLGIGFWQAKFFQESEFKRQENEEGEVIKKLILVLFEDLRAHYERLFSQPNGYSCNDFRNVILNHYPFNFDNKNAIWPILVSKEIFGANRLVFESINLINQKLEKLNSIIEILRPECHMVNEQRVEVREAKDVMLSIKRLYDENLQRNFQESSLCLQLQRIIKGNP